MLLRLSVLLCASHLIYAMQCDCIEERAVQAKRDAEIVFQGVITTFRDSTDGKRVAVFKVSRVWKGRVTSTLEMPAIQGHCSGFEPGLLKIGNELLVFASRLSAADPSDLYPQMCSTKLVQDAKDIKTLGPGKKPRYALPASTPKTP